MIERYSRYGEGYASRSGRRAERAVPDGRPALRRPDAVREGRALACRTRALPRADAFRPGAGRGCDPQLTTAMPRATAPRAFSPAAARPAPPSRRSARRILALALLLALAVGGATFAAVLAEHGAALSGAPAAGSDASTPRSEWAQGTAPYLYQTDPQWAEEPYAGGTVRENGCGPTCLSMVYVQLTGRSDLDPAGMARYSEANGYVEGDMTSWALMTEGAAGLGLRGEELPADKDAVARALAEGRPIVCSMGPGDFTTTGHFIVLVGADADGGIVVHDPNSAERSSRTWDCRLILSQCLNLWAFSAA